MVDMQNDAWLNQDHQFSSGRRLFRSERSFAVWAYTVSHSQLLLRTRTGGERSRIDVLFKPVEAMKVRTDYEGLTIRCATAGEQDHILAAIGPVGPAPRVLILETADRMDYVVAGAVGWKQDDREDHDPSALAFFPPGTDPSRVLPVAGTSTPD
jgi:hypothetical protein